MKALKWGDMSSLKSLVFLKGRTQQASHISLSGCVSILRLRLKEAEKEPGRKFDPRKTMHVKTSLLFTRLYLEEKKAIILHAGGQYLKRNKIYATCLTFALYIFFFAETISYAR